MSQMPGRVHSIDLLRGLDVLLMLFVNEIAGVRGAPASLLHAPASEDGMTITDVVFPAFLFIVGMSIPFALGGRLRRGQSRREVWRHVLSRTLALVVIGVLMVNTEHARGEGAISPALWNVLMTLGVVTVWAAPLAAEAARRRLVLRGLGVLLLLALAFAYRGGDGVGLLQIRPYGWGILGLIGWAYLVAAALYLLVGERSGVLVGSVGLLYCFQLAEAAGEGGWLGAVRPALSVGSALGTHGALVVSGVVLGVLLVRHRRDGGSERRFVGRVLGYAAALGAAGALLHTLHGLHPAFWFSKVHATPPWGLASAALTASAWAIVFMAADVRGWRRWPPVVATAGENALLAYLLAPCLLSLFALSAPLFGGTNPYETLAAGTAVGIARSAVFAWLVVRLCGLLRRRGVRLQL